MRGIQQEISQPISRQNMEALHLKFMALAKDAQEREDRVLSESYYQRAEYYLHAINYPSDSLPAAPSHSFIKKPHSDRLCSAEYKHPIDKTQLSCFNTNALAE